MNGQTILVAVAAGLMILGGHGVAVGVKKAAVGTAHVVSHVVRHPVDSAKHGAIKHAK